MDKAAQKNQKIMKCKFEGIFIDGLEGQNLIKEYVEFIQFLDSKNQEKFFLSPNEIDKIIVIDKNVWKIIPCKVELIFNKKRYEISVTLENILYRKKLLFVLTFMKKIYKFKYNDNYYFFFILESLKDYFYIIKNKHDFRIITIIDNFKTRIHPLFFAQMDFQDFTIEINYKYENFTFETLKFKDIYSLPEKIKGENLNLKLGLYTNLLEDDYNTFVYFETNERNKFLNCITRLFGMKNIIGFCGPYGTGKTITLLKFLIQSDLQRVFYINLWTVENTSSDELKNLFKYESIKLFGGNIFDKEDLFCPQSEKDIYLNIIKEIENFNDKNIFILLENIIKYLNQIQEQQKFYLIIDQYSSKYDEHNKSLKQLLKGNKNKNIYFIISSSMNNEDIRNNFVDSLDTSLFSSKENSIIDSGLNYYYVGTFIRLNNFDYYNNLLKTYGTPIIEYLNKFGNIPLFYYKLRRKMLDLKKIENIIEQEKKNIIEEIDIFYGNHTLSLDKFIDILKILSIINKKEIYFIEELSNQILNLPLKFLEIKKEEIKIKDLKIFAVVSKNQKLLKVFEEIENNDTAKLSNLMKNDKVLRDLTQFINNDHFCSKYIHLISEKKKKNIRK
jgi:hypothetical protein